MNNLPSMENKEESFDICKINVDYIGETESLCSHEFVELIYCFGGNFKIWLDQKYYNFSKDSLILINLHEVHAISSISNDKNGGYYCIHISPELLNGGFQAVNNTKYVLPFFINQDSQNKLLSIDGIEKTKILSLIEELYSAFNGQEYGFELLTEANIIKIFMHIFNIWKRNGIDQRKTINYELANKLQSVIYYINKNFSDTITAEEMAEYSDLSYSYFSRSFKSLTGNSFSEYLNFIRVSEAEKLLLTTDLNITEIALSVGFSTSSYFIQQFKALKKVSPKQYKKKYFGI